MHELSVADADLGEWESQSCMRVGLRVRRERRLEGGKKDVQCSDSRAWLEGRGGGVWTMIILG